VFTKKKIIMLSVVCLIFALGEYWIFSTIKNTFEKNTLKEMKALVKAMTSFAPSNNEALSDWIEELGAIYSDNRFFVIKGVPGEEGSEELGGDDALLELWQLPEYADTASSAAESVSYLEIYKWPKIVHFKGIPYTLMVAPIPDAENSEARATLLAAIDSTGYVSFTRLVDALALIFFALFAIGFGIATFSRDPISGYAIVVLAAIVLAFVAYPLLEAVRLTLIKDGRFSFNVWKNILSNRQYLQALWGSIQLGIVTATISTFIGFVYAFAVARTSIKGKKIDNHSCDNACHIATILSNFVYHPVIWQEWYRYQAMAWPSKCQYIWFVGIGFSADNQHVSYRIYDYARSPGGY